MLENAKNGDSFVRNLVIFSYMPLIMLNTSCHMLVSKLRESQQNPFWGLLHVCTNVWELLHFKIWVKSKPKSAPQSLRKMASSCNFKYLLTSWYKTCSCHLLHMDINLLWATLLQQVTLKTVCKGKILMRFLRFWWWDWAPSSPKTRAASANVGAVISAWVAGWTSGNVRAVAILVRASYSSESEELHLRKMTVALVMVPELLIILLSSYLKVLKFYCPCSFSWKFF